MKTLMKIFFTLLFPTILPLSLAAMEKVIISKEESMSDRAFLFSDDNPNNQKKVCSICMDEESTKFYSLTCSHSYCINCLSLLSQLALKEKTIPYLKCSDITCRKVIELTDLQKIMITSDYEKIVKLMNLKKNIQNPAFKNCPTLNCDGYFINTYGVGKIINCSECATAYCSNCLKNHKQNLSCSKAALISLEINKKENSDNDKESKHETLTQQWKDHNTKTCPACKTNIQKTGGCQKIKCSKCQRIFQWNS